MFVQYIQAPKDTVVCTDNKGVQFTTIKDKTYKLLLRYDSLRAAYSSIIEHRNWCRSQGVKEWRVLIAIGSELYTAVPFRGKYYTPPYAPTLSKSE